MIFDHSDYRDILKAEFAVRNSHNPSYSMRGFARDLNLSPSRLSEIFKEQQGLSAKKAELIAKRLNYSRAEREYFVTLTEATSGRSKLSRDAAKIRLRKFGHSQIREQSIEIFDIISNWEHLAIIELLNLSGARSSSRWIADQLGIRKDQAEIAIERLISVGLLTRAKGKLKRTDDSMFVWSTEIPSSSIKNYHKGVILQALRALYTTPIDQREFSSIVVPVSESVIPEAKKMIKKFTFELNQLLTKKSRKTRVYYFASQLFPISKG